MSNAGLAIYNNSGYLQIDDTYNNLYLFRKMKLSDIPYNNDYGAYVFTPMSGEICYAFGCKDRTKKVSAMICDARDGNGRYVHPANLICISYYQADSSEPAVSELDIYAFGARDTRVPTHGQGLCVYDVNGNATYCSDDKSMRVLFFGIPPYFYGSDKDVALISRDWAFDYVKISGGSWDTRAYKRIWYPEIDNGYLKLKSREYPVSITPPQYENGETHEQLNQCVLIDVTGY